jgi:hypothetical protein
VSLVVGAMELSGSLVDVWFDGLLHDVGIVELFLLCRIYGGIWNLSLIVSCDVLFYSLFCRCGWFHCCLFIVVSVTVLSVALFSLVCVWKFAVYCWGGSHGRFEAGQLLIINNFPCHKEFKYFLRR